MHHKFIEIDTNPGNGIETAELWNNIFVNMQNITKIMTKEIVKPGFKTKILLRIKNGVDEEDIIFDKDNKDAKIELDKFISKIKWNIEED